MAVSSASASAPADEPVEAAAARWLDRFRALDLPGFLAFFAEDATLFHPAPVAASGRRVGREAWVPVFADLRARSRRTAPPYLDLQPADLRVQSLGHDAAVISFHLGEGAWPGRRTTVWRRDAGEWRIVHLHASRLLPNPLEETP